MGFNTHRETETEFQLSRNPNKDICKTKNWYFVKVGFVKKEEEEKEIKVSPSSPFAQRERYLRENFHRERERERELIVSELEDFGV